MAKFKPSVLLAGASIVAVTAGILVACAHDKPGAVAEAGMAPIPDRPDWNWDVRPILSQNCFACHGQGTQKAGLRLDIEKAAYGDIPEDKGKRALVPGNINKSELWKRITSNDVDVRMPPKESHKTLSPHDIAVIERWIKQGAKYKQHWAYIPPAVVKPEKTKWDDQAVNSVDRYIYAGLAKEGLQPAKEADRETLINRVTLDLTGLPPTLQEVDAFVADKDPGAYEKLVDKLLASKEYAERQTNIWLDVARYADTRGGLNDGERSLSFPYRDWVISAFANNMPYDQFVTWQLAGDKLNNGNPSRDQLLATAFLKAGRQDSEGGSIDEEYRTNYVQERTELVGKDFLGLTVGCAKCHNHKYDVIAQADYYSISGFFNQMDERGGSSGNRGTVMGTALEWPTAKQSKKLNDAHAATVAKEAAYQAALRTAQTKADAQAAAISATQRADLIKTAIDADTQAYYPLDDGYKASFESLYIPETPQAFGVPKKGTQVKEPVAEETTRLQKKILADVAAGKPTPVLDGPAGPAPMDGKGGKKGEGKGGEGHAKGEGHKGDGQKAEASKAEGKHMHGGGHEIAAGDEGKSGAPKAIKVADHGGGAKAKAEGGKPSDAKAGGKGGKGGEKPGGRVRNRGFILSDAAARVSDPGLPRVASYEIDAALEQLLASGFQDARLGSGSRVQERQLPALVNGKTLLWTKSGLKDGAPGYLSNATFVPGAKGQGVLLNNTIVATDPSVGKFERTQPYSLDLWVKLRAKPYEDSTRPAGPSAAILNNNGGIDTQGYELDLANGHLSYQIVHNAPANMLKVSTTDKLPTGRWVHITSTYDGNSKAAGMHLYVDGKEAKTVVEHDHLTRSASPRGANTQNGSYFGLASGVNFNRPELIGGAIDEIRVITRALTPLEVAYLQDPKLAAAAPAADARAELALASAQKDPAVQQAWADLSEARLNEQKADAAISQIMVAGDQPQYRKTFVLDRGVYNSYMQEVKPQAIPRVFPWSDKLPRNRLGLVDWLFDPKQPLTARVYVNRMWQNHFGTGIVQTVDDFGTQGTNPTNPELLDYLAVEFVKSGWNIKHLQKLMVMSATYRQDSNISRENLEKDPRNFLLERGPRFRMPAEIIRDNALTASGLLVKHVGGDAVFPYAPDAIWDGVAQGAVIYPTNVPADENHRRSMYTFVKRNSPVPNLVPFDMPDRYNASVVRPISNTPLQGLVMLNDPQFMEAYRKLAERAIKSSSNEDQQISMIWRLAVRRLPMPAELEAAKHLLASQYARLQAKPEAAKQILDIGLAKSDPAVDPARLAAMTLVTAGVMNTPDAYTLR